MPSSHNEEIKFFCREEADSGEGEIIGQVRIAMINGKVIVKQIPINSEIWTTVCFICLLCRDGS